MKPINKIALATDFSPTAELALRTAVSLARLTGAELVLIHAHAVTAAESSIARNVHMRSDAIDTASRKEVEAARARLEALRAQTETEGVTVSAELVHGPADDAVAEVGHRVGADLVIVGSQGRTGLSRMVLGSVAEEILNRWTGSILVARSESTTNGFCNIVAATDHSPLAGLAIDTARALAAPGAKIEIVHCTQLDGDDETVAPPPSSRARGEASANKIRTDDIQVSFSELAGAPAQAISNHVRDSGADLVALGSRRSDDRALLGSIAERVLRGAPCSVLIARDPSIK